MVPHVLCGAVNALLGLSLLLGYRYDYTIHGSSYTSAHVLIENTLVQYKIMAKNSRMALCCLNRVSKGTKYRLYAGFEVTTEVRSPRKPMYRPPERVARGHLFRFPR